MLEGKRPEECGICWGIEDLPGGQVSDRHLRSVDGWVIPFFDQVKSLPWNADINPSYVEVSFSANCNFKCSYCSPHVSSRWLDEINKNGPYRLSEGQHQSLTWLKQNDYMPIEDENNPYVEAFWKWWPDLVKTLMFFRITGGEPLLSNETFKVLNWLRENPQPQLRLSINSNLGAPERYMDRFFEAVAPLLRDRCIRSFELHTSLDTYGKQAEYIRHGLDFSYFERNVRRYLETLPQATLAFMCTFNNLSVVGFDRYIDWMIELRRQYQAGREIFLDLPHLMGPRHQSVKILTADFHERVRNSAAKMESLVDPKRGIKDAEVEKMRRILAWMGSPSPENWLLGARRDFHLFFSQHDQRRGTHFLDTFPEMEEFWNLCRSLC
jgi:hypothetical protein